MCSSDLVAAFKLIVEQADHRDLSIFRFTAQRERIRVPCVVMANLVLCKLNALHSSDVVVPLAGFIGLHSESLKDALQPVAGLGKMNLGFAGGNVGLLSIDPHGCFSCLDRHEVEYDLVTHFITKLTKVPKREVAHTIAQEEPVGIVTVTPVLIVIGPAETPLLFVVMV